MSPEGTLKTVGPTGDGGPQIPGSPGRRRGVGQRIALGVAMLFYICAVLSLGMLALWVGELGGSHPVIASLGASVVFFIGAGIVLHVIGRADLPDLGIRRNDSESAPERP